MLFMGAPREPTIQKMEAVQEAADAAVRHSTAAGLVFTTGDNGLTEWAFYPFELRPTDGQGLGAWATRSYEKGARIFTEWPLAMFVVPDRERVRRDDAMELINRMVDALNPMRKASFFSLAQASKHGPNRSAVGIWLSNAYPMDSEGSGDKQGVFAQLCRINHSCQPNVTTSWNARLRRQTIHATRSIRAGEELLISYYGVDGQDGLVRAERQELIMSKMGFHCSCALCGLTGDALARSEGRQRRLRAISDAVTTEPRPRFSRMRALVSEAITLMEQEGLPASWAKLHMLRLVGSAADAGDVKAAEEWASRAAACARDASGSDSAEYAAIRQ